MFAMYVVHKKAAISK